MSYAGTRGLRLPVYRNGNQVPLEALPADQRAALATAVAAGRDTTALLQPMRPYPEFDNITLSENVGISTYHSGQARLIRRMSKGLTLDASYTFSKPIDTASDFNSADPSEQVLNAINLAGQRAVSSFDVPLRFTASGQCELPRFAEVGSFWRPLLGGWSLNALVTLHSPASRSRPS